MDSPAVEKPVNVTEKFFDIPASAPAIVKRVAAELQRQNNITGFIPGFIKQNGYTVWDKARVGLAKNKSQGQTNNFGGNGTRDSIVILPFVHENGDEVSSFIVSRVNDSTKLNLYRASDYDRYRYGDVNATTVTADKIAFELLLLNESIFGHRKYKVTDSLLFNEYDGAKFDSAYRTIFGRHQ